MKDEPPEFPIFTVIDKKSKIYILNNYCVNKGGNIFEFSLFHNTELYDKLHIANFIIELYLINPDGVITKSIKMEESQRDQPSTDGSINAKYLCIIDLEDFYNDRGLWHHFFSIKNNTNQTTIFFPTGGYLIGPAIGENEFFMTGGAVSSKPNHYMYRAGFKSDVNNYPYLLYYINRI